MKTNRIQPETAIFFECDIQDKFRDLMQNYAAVAHNAGRLAQMAKLFQIPLVSTKHVKFGDTDPSVSACHDDEKNGLVKHFEKFSFSMAANEDVRAFYL